MKNEDPLNPVDANIYEASDVKWLENWAAENGDHRQRWTGYSLIIHLQRRTMRRFFKYCFLSVSCKKTIVVYSNNSGLF